MKCRAFWPTLCASVQALGDIFQGQGDYWQLTRGGGHGDYRTIVLAPSGVQETCDLAYGAFDLAEKYRHPVILGSDAAIGQMLEPVELPEMRQHSVDAYPWAIRGRRKGEAKKVIMNTFYAMGTEAYPAYLLEKYRAMEENEQRWQCVCTQDAEIILVAYGISAPHCQRGGGACPGQGDEAGPYSAYNPVAVPPAGV